MPRGRAAALRGIFGEMLDDVLTVARRSVDPAAAGRRLPPGATPPAPRPSPRAPRPEPLRQPSQPVSTNDHPYVRPTHSTPEVDAVPGDVPVAPPPRVTHNPDGLPEPPPRALDTFQGDVRHEVWPAGEARYRVVGDGSYAGGPFWTRDAPASEHVLRSDSAVLNEWNGNHGVVAYRPSQDIDSWVGEAAPQPGSGSTPANPYHLPGGGEQIWIDRGAIPADDLVDGAPGWTIEPSAWTGA
ncbi:hypothetical protein [Auraticoccus monumenti]|uniref:Uncharacterized protein n=1 Tax=Auraticoccus monumenti TaxID=675864 RepID=A0A1G6W1L0_9ACTN|nr:hypothetical protein [Auraticoccus monumenti]SDD58936.1 hypothetical protein SAMN04489747_1299 [Auraticoccus monumenti]